jgi:ABC-type multidrug transport system fused ATPase/permease subunit
VLSWLFTGRAAALVRHSTAAAAAAAAAAATEDGPNLSDSQKVAHDGPTAAYVALGGGEEASGEARGAGAVAGEGGGGDDNDEAGKSDGPSVSRLIALSRPEWPAMGAATLALIVSTLAGLATPTYFGKMIDTISRDDEDDNENGGGDDPNGVNSNDNNDNGESQALRKLNEITLELLCIFAVGAVFTFFRGAIFNSAGERVVARVRRRLFSAMLAQEIGFFDSNKTGDLMNRLSSDTTKLQDAATTNVSMFLRSFVSLVLSLALLFYTSWSLTLVALAVVPAIIVAAALYGRFMKKLSRRYQDMLAKASDVSQESISNVRTTRSFAAEQVEFRKYARRVGDPDRLDDTTATTNNSGVNNNSDVNRGGSDVGCCSWLPEEESSYKLGVYKAIGYGAFAGGMSLMGYSAVVCVLWYGGRLVISGELSTGALISFVLYVSNIGASLATLAGLFSSVMEAIGASARVFEIIDRVPKIRLSGGHRPPLLSSHSSTHSSPASSGPPAGFGGGFAIAFEDVSFHYPSRPDVTVLRHISLTVAENSTTALVGPSGGGKTTLFSLLLRFYEPSSGRITVASHDLMGLDPSFVRRRMALVSQEPVLFAMSIRDNIAYGWQATASSSSSERPSKAQVEAAARAANAEGFILGFPEGYDTLVGERGVRLSGGQKQRIAIARALMVDPAVLLLDEATSALDSESEHLVQEAIDRAMVGRTVLVIAHRLSTVVHADLIAVVDGRTIVGRGSHEELLSGCATYADLVKRQMQQGRSSSDNLLPQSGAAAGRREEAEESAIAMTTATGDGQQQQQEQQQQQQQQQQPEAGERGRGGIYY